MDTRARPPLLPGSRAALGAGLLAALAWLAPPAGAAPARQAGAERGAGLDWWTLDRDVVRQLATRDVGRWSAELALARARAGAPAEERAPLDVATLVLGLDVHLRAGHVARAADAVAALARVLPAEPAAGVETALAATCDMAIERGAWDVAFALCERFPSVEPGSAAELVAELARRSDAAWVDAWVAARARDSAFWFWQRLAARFEQGTLGALVAELEREVARETPGTQRHAEAAARWRAALRCAEGLVAWEPARERARSGDEGDGGDGADRDGAPPGAARTDPSRTHAARLVAELDAAARRGEASAVLGELAWRALARGPWGRHERALLERVARAVEGSLREAVWRRAEGLAAPVPGERALALGSILVRCRGEETRGIDWLERALASAASASDRAAAAFALFEAFLATGDVERAQAVWSQASEHPPTGEVPLWLGALALEAARQGRTADALRLWTLRVNLDRGELAQLEHWADLGLARPVAELYRVMARQDPASRAPARALARLAELR